MAFTPTVQVTPYPFWTAFTPTLPSMYWDVDSHEERIKRICLELCKLLKYADYLGDSINLDHKEIEELQEAFQKFIDGEYDDYYKKLISDWISDNFANLISEGVRQVYFGLTDDGYFCAYVPESWSEITFDTGAVFGRSDYGRLILRFDADGEGVIDNTYSYSLNASPTAFQQLVRDLEVTANRGDATYDAVFTNVSEVIPNGNF